MTMYDNYITTLLISVWSGIVDVKLYYTIQYTD